MLMNSSTYAAHARQGQIVAGNPSMQPATISWVAAVSGMRTLPASELKRLLLDCRCVTSSWQGYRSEGILT
jgi:hypothetical protein